MRVGIEAEIPNDAQHLLEVPSGKPISKHIVDACAALGGDVHPVIDDELLPLE